MKLQFSIRTVRGLVLSLVLALLFSITFFAPLRTFLQAQLYATGEGINYITKFIFSKKARLQSEINDLQDERDQYLSELVELEDLRLINKELREVIAFEERNQVEYSFHNVISNFRYLGLEKLIADNNGVAIEEGQAVIVSNGHLIGRVGASSNFEFETILLQDKTSSIPAKVLGIDGATGIIKGQGGFQLEMEFIPSQIELEVGQVVVSDAIGQLVPEGLVIGSIKNIEKVSSSPFQTAIVEPFINPYDYSIVAIQ